MCLTFCIQIPQFDKVCLIWTLLAKEEENPIFLAQNGQYTSTIKKGNTWYHCNDSQIKETNLNQEINDAYILFYKF